ncbi:MAG: hypothetical protein WBD12_02235 [Candidatus Omnitrophota bacterium]
MVIYEGGDGENDIVHRVLSVNKNEKCALVKGDNIPFKHAEKIPFTSIREKVVSVKRKGKIIDLERAICVFFSRLTAFLSRYDLTPNLFRKKFIDPFFLAAVRNPIYIYFRKRSYANIHFMCKYEGRNCRIYAFVGKTKSSEAFVRSEREKKVLVSSHIRYRDRNPFFAGIFLSKLVEIIQKEYGSGSIYLTDPVFWKLIDPVKLNGDIFFKP